MEMRRVVLSMLSKISTSSKRGAIPTPWKCVKGFNKRNESKDFPKAKVFERDPLRAN